MANKIKNYIITYISYSGEEKIIDSKGYLNKNLEDKPLYNSLKNARKSLTKIRNILRKPETISRMKYWYDRSLEENNNSTHNQMMIDDYLDLIYINENNTLKIREVDIIIGKEERN